MVCDAIINILVTIGRSVLKSLKIFSKLGTILIMMKVNMPDAKTTRVTG